MYAFVHSCADIVIDDAKQLVTTSLGDKTMIRTVIFSRQLSGIQVTSDFKNTVLPLSIQMRRCGERSYHFSPSTLLKGWTVQIQRVTTFKRSAINDSSTQRENADFDLFDVTSTFVQGSDVKQLGLPLASLVQNNRQDFQK